MYSLSGPVSHSVPISSNSNSQIKYFYKNPKNISTQFSIACFKSEISQKSSSITSYEELGFKEMETGEIELDTERKRDKLKGGGWVGDEESELGFNVAGLDNLRQAMIGDERPEKERDELGVKLEELNQRKVGATSERRRGRQLMKRSNLLAKQVISNESALNLGFVSQLWVDTISWIVLGIEVRPNLLSGEIEKFFLEDVRQVGDVVLIQDEGVVGNDLPMSGLETLVGYDVITPDRQYIGKVRGYTFNINSGAVESLELDSFGISIIPSSLVSTYALLVEDVLKVASDTVVVHEAAALRMQRLTKGVWGSQKLGSSLDELDKYMDDLERQSVKIEKGRTKQRTSRQTFGPRKRADLDDWELPKDYL